MIWSYPLGIVSLTFSGLVSSLIVLIFPLLKGVVPLLGLSVIIAILAYLFLNRIISQKSPSLLTPEQPTLLKISFAISILAIMLTLFSQSVKELREISYILSFLADTFIAFGTIRYAQNKGRSGFWGVLGTLGLIIVFFLPNKQNLNQLSVNKSSLTDYVLGGILSISLFFQGLYMMSVQPPKIIPLMDISPGMFVLFTTITLIVLLFALIANRRSILTIGLWISVIFSFISLFYYPDRSGVSQYFMHIRNWFFFCLIIYPVFHLVVHRLAKIIKHKRQILTPEGFVQYRTIIYTYTFLWGVWDLVMRLYDKFV